MAWDERGYFYRSRRVGGRVVREHFGNGPLAEAAAAFRQFHTSLDRATAAHLLAAGFYRHDGGRSSC